MSVIWQQKTHGVLRRQRKTNRIVARLLLSVVLVVTVLSAAYLTLVAANVHLARQVWAMEKEMVNIQRGNQAIQTEVGRLSSIPVLQARSVALGFQPAHTVEYMVVGGP